MSDERADPCRIRSASGSGSLRSDERGVSEVIGTIMMVGVTVTLMAALSLLVLTWPLLEDPISANLRVERGADVDLVHGGGEEIPKGDADIIVTHDGQTTRLPLAAFSAEFAAGDPDLWEVGERLCISCRFAGQTIDRIVVAGPSDVILTWDAPPNRGPAARFTFSPTSPLTGETVTFDASGSTDPEEDSLTYEWDWTDDGSFDTTHNDPTDTTTHTYSSPGTFTVRLRISDGNGGTDTTTKTVTVTDLTYLDCPMTDNVGTSSNCANAQSASDGDAVATLTEEDTATTGQSDYNLEIVADFTGVPTGTHELQIRYRLGGTDEDVDVEVWDGSVWTDRGDLTAETLTVFTYTLTSAEYNGGAPQIRFVDKVADDTTQTSLDLEYVRVATT